jgi:nucleotide-binding universal stress UspA family protein
MTDAPTSRSDLLIDLSSVASAEDNLKEAAAGYDTTVMGRKDQSALKEVFLGSISQKVLHAAKDRSVLIVC